MRIFNPLGALAGVIALGSAQVVSAETLQDALALAYDSNPGLQQQRAQLRALDETYVQALSGYRPTLGVSATVYYDRYSPSSGPSLTSRTAQATVTATQPLYTGGRVSAAVRAAEAEVLAGRETLRSQEAGVLQQVIAAYVDVRRDTEIVEIRRANVEVIKAQLDETSARFKVGQLTRTDVATVSAQYAQARAALAGALGQMKSSRAAYLAVIGRAPGTLAAETPLPGAPRSLDEAFDVAEARNPSLLAASLKEQSDLARMAQARAARMPTVSASASFSRGAALGAYPDHNDQSTLVAGVTVTQPLFSGGLVSSQIRAALEQDNADRQALEQARRATIQSVSVAWNQILAARSGLSASLEQKDAAALAFDGVKQEFRAGLRTVFEFVQAEQGIRDAELSVVNARHDAYVADAALLAAVGRLDVASLGLDARPYDPSRNLDRVRGGLGAVFDPLAGALDRINPNGTPPALDAHRGTDLAPLKIDADTTQK
jgi:outer membrane protein